MVTKIKRGVSFPKCSDFGSDTSFRYATLTATIKLINNALMEWRSPKDAVSKCSSWRVQFKGGLQLSYELGVARQGTRERRSSLGRRWIAICSEKAL